MDGSYPDGFALRSARLSMKVGDLIRDVKSGRIGIIVQIEMVNNGFAPAGELEPYHRCLIGKDFIWLFTYSLELIDGI